MTSAEPCVRSMCRRDVPYCLIIEHDSFDEPASERDFLKAVTGRNGFGLVVEYDGEIIGYARCETKTTRLEVYCLAVHPLYRRRGVGRFLVRRLIAAIGGKRRNLRFLVPDSETRAHIFLKSCGLACIAVVRHAFDNTQDGYVFNYHLQPEAVQQ